MATFDDPRRYRWLRNRPQAEASERPIQEELAQLHRQQQLAAALQEQGRQGAPQEWSRMAMVPEYGIGHGLTQLASSLGGAYLDKQAGRKRQEIAKKLQETEQDMYRSAVGGANPANLEQTDPLAVRTSPEKLPDRDQMMQMAMSPEGRMALQENPVLAQIVAGQMKGPEAFTLSPGQQRFAGGQVVASVPDAQAGKAPPTSVAEYEYARANGYPGSFQDWITAGGQSSRPSSVQEWEFYNSLLEEDKKNGTNRAGQYLEMKRNPNFFYGKVNEVPTVTRAPTAGQPAQSTPLSTLPSEAAAASTLAEAGAAGKAVGEATGGQAAKMPAAASMDYVIEEFDKQLDKTTQGGLGGISGRLASVTDYEDAQRFDNLREQLSTELRTVYRIPGEGTLSDREQQQYGLQLPARTNTEKTNRQILRDLRQRTRLRLETPPGGKPKPATRKRYNPATGKIE